MLGSLFLDLFFLDILKAFKFLWEFLEGITEWKKHYFGFIPSELHGNDYVCVVLCVLSDHISDDWVLSPCIPVGTWTLSPGTHSPWHVCPLFFLQDTLSIPSGMRLLLAALDEVPLSSLRPPLAQASCLADTTVGGF